MKDVLVIGSGITGLATAHALEQRGYTPAIASPEEADSPPTSTKTAGMAIGGQIDNYTRVSHAHGNDFAASLWSFGNRAFESLLSFCQTHGVSYHRGRRYRLITSEQELTEAKLAVKQLQAAGFTGQILKTRPPGLSPRVLAVQDEGDWGASVDSAAVLETLNKLVKAPRYAGVRTLKSTGRGIEALLTNGKTVHAEIAVLACHLEIGQLLPNLRTALVSVADQWLQINTGAEKRSTPWDQLGCVFSANHTYEWGVMSGDDTLNMGGGRYLRPMAGIEATTAPYEPKINTHLIGQLRKTFTWTENVVATGIGASALDCRPCDELPIIGPMYGDERLLVGTGYMGSGLTQGFLAGSCLAELIDTGHSSTLPRRLWPERLRSLAD